MPAVPTREIVQAAFKGGYAVGAFNVVSDLTMEAVLAAADAIRSPVIVQTSLKTVRSIGADVLMGMWRPMSARVRVPVALHLDHCPDREAIRECLAAGWSSVLFDASSLSIEENERQCVEVVAEARRHGADVEGEIEGIRGVEDDVGSDEESSMVSLEVATRFIRRTGVDIFAPAVGNAHGIYTESPQLDAQRVSDLVAATGIPMALHGGSGLSRQQFEDLIGRGCAKVNISTALKVSYLDAMREYLDAHASEHDPPRLFEHVRTRVMAMVTDHLRTFGSEGRA